MRYLIPILLSVLTSVTASAQIDQVVDSKIASRVAAENIQGKVNKAVDSAMTAVVWYTELQLTVTRSGSFNMDTLTAANNSTEVYQLALTGAGTAFRIVFVTNTGGVYTARIVNPAAYSGPTGTAFNTVVGTGGVIVSMTGNNTSRTYKYGRKNL